MIGGKKHPDNQDTMDGFWDTLPISDGPSRLKALEHCESDLAPDIGALFRELRKKKPHRPKKFKPENERFYPHDSDLQEMVGEPYDPQERRTPKHNWRRATALGALCVMTVVGTGVLAFTETKQRQQEIAQHKAAVGAALRDVDTLGALGICSVELQAEAEYLSAVKNKQITGSMPAEKAYVKAATLAGDWNLPCDSQVRKVSAVIDKDYSQRERLTASDIVDFNLADACEDAKTYSANPSSYTYDLSRAMTNAAMAYDAGIKC